MASITTMAELFNIATRENVIELSYQLIESLMQYIELKDSYLEATLTPLTPLASDWAFTFY